MTANLGRGDKHPKVTSTDPQLAARPPADVVQAADSVVDFIHGFALAEGAQPPERPFDRRELLERLEAGAADGLPSTSHVFGALTREESRYDFDRGFEDGLGILLKGIEASAVGTSHFREDPL